MKSQWLPGAFAWDRVFKPSIMQRVLVYLGLKKDAIVRFLNYPSFALAILFLLPFFPLAWAIRLIVGQRYVHRVHPLFGWLWLAAFGVYRRVFYHPAVRRDEPYIYMAEHFNLIDVPLYGSTWRGDVRALSATEYRSVPMYGWILRACGTQFIERRDRAHAIEDLKALAVRMREANFSVLVAPAGTRAQSASLLPFKLGVFHLAVALQKPIVPIYLVGLEHLIVGKNHCKPGRVDVVYGEPIRPEAYPAAFHDAHRLMQLVRDRMLSEGEWLRQQRETVIANGRIDWDTLHASQG